MTIRLPGVSSADDGFFKSSTGTTEAQEQAAAAYVRRRAKDAEDVDLLLDVLGLTDVAMRPDAEGVSLPAPGSAMPAPR